MNGIRIGLVAAAALALASPAVAQEAPRMPAFGAEEALRFRANLELTDQQIARLQALRREHVDAQAAHMKEMMELQSRFRAGDLTPEALQSEMQSRREAMRDRMVGRQDAVSQVLNDTQRAKLTELGRGAMRRDMRRGMHFRDRAPRGGFGPRMRPQRMRPGGGRPG